MIMLPKVLVLVKPPNNSEHMINDRMNTIEKVNQYVGVKKVHVKDILK